MDYNAECKKCICRSCSDRLSCGGCIDCSSLPFATHKEKCDKGHSFAENEQLLVEENNRVIDTNCSQICEQCLCNTCNERHFKCSEHCSRCENFMKESGAYIPICRCDYYEKDDFI